MLDRMAVGNIPPKHHLAHRQASGALCYEECLTRRGFDGPYSILYHQNPPQQHRPLAEGYGWKQPSPAPSKGLSKRHFRTQDSPSTGGSTLDTRRPIAFNEDVSVSLLQPTEPDPIYISNADADTLFFIHKGSGVLLSPFGRLPFKELDYVCVPKGVMVRFLPTEGVEQRWISIECFGGVEIPQKWRNEAGQLRMDAPYCHRDFQRPQFEGPEDDGVREVAVKRGGEFTTFELPSSPMDVVGWDGTVYPWVFPMLAFQPRTGQVHLPPDWHGTFAARGLLIMSFVPRPTDFHASAVPCPYPHSSVDCDELLFYCGEEFTSRTGTGSGSVTLHPAGIPHGPQPGNYEGSIGTSRTEELALMVDTFRPLQVAEAALELEDESYMASFYAPRSVRAKAS
jgi:homogentisate 1,2-dioxygenase